MQPVQVCMLWSKHIENVLEGTEQTKKLNIYKGVPDTMSVCATEGKKFLMQSFSLLGPMSLGFKQHVVWLNTDSLTLKTECKMYVYTVQWWFKWWISSSKTER